MAAVCHAFIQRNFLRGGFAQQRLQGSPPLRQQMPRYILEFAISGVFRISDTPEMAESGLCKITGANDRVSFVVSAFIIYQSTRYRISAAILRLSTDFYPEKAFLLELSDARLYTVGRYIAEE